MPKSYNHIAGNSVERLNALSDGIFGVGMTLLVLDLRVPAGSDIRIPQLADGHWHLRARRIDPDGLEGLDAVHDIDLHASPESPYLVEPAAGAKLPAGDVPLRWTKSPEAARYVVDVPHSISNPGNAVVHALMVVVHAS